MNIWAFPSFYPIDTPGLRGAGIFAHRQYKGLMELGAKVKVIQPILWYPPYPFSHLNDEWAQLSKIEYPSVRIYDGIEVFHPRISNRKPSRFLGKPYAERYVDCIVHFFMKMGISLDITKDVFYAQWIPEAALVVSAAKILGIRCAILGIGDDVNIWPHQTDANRKVFNEAWIDADFRFVVADYLGQQANIVSSRQLPYSVIRRGVENDIFKPVKSGVKTILREKLHLPIDKLIILMVGSPIVMKGWLQLLDAVNMLKVTRNDFVLVGVYSGNSDLDISFEVNKRSLGDVFISLGEVAPEEIKDCYNAADIFCLPSLSEGIANAVVEAMSCGLPVVATSVGGHRELITHMQNGILIPPADPEILYQQLKYLLDNPDECFRLGKEARRHIVEEWGSFAFNAKKILDEFLVC